MNLIRFLTAPKLNTLILNSCGDISGGTSVDEDVGAFITRSGCKVRYLDLSKSWTELRSDEHHHPAPIPSFLTKTSRDLEELCLWNDTHMAQSDASYNPTCNGLLARMIATDNSQGLSPHLKVLLLRDLKLDAILLARIIQSETKCSQSRGAMGKHGLDPRLSEWKFRTR